MAVPEQVRITDVSPRDGLQNEPGVTPTEGKARLVRLLAAAGVHEVEVTSFVSPRWVPQLGDAERLLGLLRVDRPRICLSALVPNDTGMQNLLSVNISPPHSPHSHQPPSSSNAAAPVIDKVCLFTAASETFNRRNINASIAESFVRFEPVLRSVWENRLGLKIYISCAFGCPFEDRIDPRAVRGVVRSALDALAEPARRSLHGGYSHVEISLADTIGTALPGDIPRVVDPVRECLAEPEPGVGSSPALNLHLHDTFGHAAECVRAALEAGVRSFDGSVAGLGGCPYAGTPERRAPGNISTELLVRTVREEGYATPVDENALGTAADFARSLIATARGSPGGPS